MIFINHSEKVRYIIIGIFNTMFGYSVGIVLFTILSEKLHTILIVSMANMLSIIVSFFMHKLFVFRRKGKWINEFFRACIVYMNMALVSVFIMWVFIDILNISIWISQAIAICTTFSLTYFGHKKFTFH